MKPVWVALIAGVTACIVLQPACAVARGRVEAVLHSFGSGSDGKLPDAGLIDVKGTLYGTTSVGGAYNNGTVFAVDATTGAETVAHDFNGIDGQGPQATPIDVNGRLYGTTNGGGAYNDGTVFSFNPKTGKEKVVYSFCSVCGDGTNPQGGLIAVNGTLYGTAAHDGDTACQYGCGTVFSVDPDTGVEKTVYAFQGGGDGEYPWAGLIAVNGVLYGTTLDGGASGNGTVFAVDPNTGAETVIHSFGSGTDSQEPQGDLTAVNDVLYGVTLYGGTRGFGTVFSLDLGNGTAQVIHSFCGRKCLDGAYPFAGLIAVKGRLYGTTSEGGKAGCFSMGCGAVFVVDPATGAEKVVYAFKSDGSRGEQPVGSLIHLNGTFYGTTSYGGASGKGTVFALKKR